MWLGSEWMDDGWIHGSKVDCWEIKNRMKQHVNAFLYNFDYLCIFSYCALHTRKCSFRNSSQFCMQSVNALFCTLHPHRWTSCSRVTACIRPKATPPIALVTGGCYVLMTHPGAAKAPVMQTRPGAAWVPYGVDMFRCSKGLCNVDTFRCMQAQEPLV